MFLVCPVRAFLLPDGKLKPDELLTPEEREEKAAVEAYVMKGEGEGIEFYWPSRDTDQTDLHGWDICCMGMLKKVVIANPESGQANSVQKFRKRASEARRSHRQTLQNSLTAVFLLSSPCNHSYEWFQND